MPVRIQNHIHLQPISEMPQGGWATDGAPDATYKVARYDPSPTVYVRVDTAVTGDRIVQRLTDNSGNVIRHNDTLITLKCTLAEYNTIVGYLGQDCHFVPPEHPDAGEDHSAYLVSVVLESIRRAQGMMPMLSHWYVTLRLLEI